MEPLLPAGGATAYSGRVRVAFVGKGGAGKSSVAGLLVRRLAAHGSRVLALDSDPMPGLAFSLGLEPVDTGIPADAVQAYDDNGRQRYRLREGLTPAEVVERFAVVGPDGIRVLQLGKSRGRPGENARSQQAFQQVLDDLPGDWDVVGDLPGGTRQPFFGWGRFARTVVVVVEPTPASLLSGRRLSRLALMPSAPRVVAVASKTRGPEDAGLVARATGLPVLAEVPFDPALAEADRHGRSLADQGASTPALVGVASLLEALRAEEEPG